MTIKLIVGVFSFVFSANTLADCSNGTKLIFGCKAQNGKLIQVCDSAKTIYYSFGLPSKKPELAFKVNRDQVTTSQWTGIGSSMNYSVELPNGKAIYSVYWAANRNSEEPEIFAGVNVIINKKSIATVKCFVEEGLTQELEGINLKPTFY
jgi:hypothetical protein